MWRIVLTMAVGGLVMGVIIVASSDLYTYLKLQRKLRAEKEIES